MDIRKQIIEKLRDRLSDIIPDTPVIDAYEKFLLSATDKEIEYWVQALENGVQDIPDTSRPATTITLIVPNLDRKNRLSIQRNFALAEKMGHSFFERIWLTNPVTGQTTLTNKRYLVMELPVRRQAQTLDAKISLPEDDHQIDELTGQVTGDSKGSSISYPEIQMLDAKGLEQTILELLRPRGGDEQAWRLAKKRLLESGEFSLEELDQLDSRAKVNDTFASILHGMHIKHNL